MNNVYVIGGSQTDFSRNFTKEGKGTLALLKEVLDDALNETSISKKELIELNKKGRVCFFVGNFIGELYTNQGHLGALISKVDPAYAGIPSARYEAACASGSTALDAAITKIRVGDYDLAIVVGWELMKTVNPSIGGDILGRAAYYEEEAKNVEFPFPKLFGKLVDELIEKYNLEEKRLLNNLATISNKNYSNAKRNPNAQTRKWYMSYPMC